MKTGAFLTFLFFTSVVFATDPYCVYRKCEDPHGGSSPLCHPCGDPIPTCERKASKRAFYYICQNCTIYCQSSPYLVGSCEPQTESLLEDDGRYFAIDLSDNYAGLTSFVEIAPELVLLLAASSTSENIQIENDIRSTAPVDQRATRARSALLPSPDFAYRALNGTLREEDVAELTTPTEAGTVLQLESWAVPLPGGKMQLNLRSSIVRANGSETETVEILNSAVATLGLIEKNHAVVQGFEAKGSIAALYRLEGLELSR